jgi:urease accessory protein
MSAALLQLASPSLPVGGFAYSRGLEAAVELGWVVDAAGARAWIEGLLHEAVGRLEGPLLLRLHRAFAAADREAVERWADLAIASRETEELARESRTMGAALARWVRELELASPEELAAPVRDAYLATFALAAERLGLDARDAVRAHAWSWLDASVTAAIKLVPLGQTEGQRILRDLGRALEALVEAAEAVPDEDVGALAPGLAMASARHETQHTRLFRS